jgi:hypothetical protein
MRDDETGSNVSIMMNVNKCDITDIFLTTPSQRTTGHPLRLHSGRVLAMIEPDVTWPRV